LSKKKSHKEGSRKRKRDEYIDIKAERERCVYNKDEEPQIISSKSEYEFCGQFRETLTELSSVINPVTRSDTEIKRRCEAMQNNAPNAQESRQPFAQSAVDVYCTKKNANFQSAKELWELIKYHYENGDCFEQYHVAKYAKAMKDCGEEVADPRIAKLTFP